MNEPKFVRRASKVLIQVGGNTLMTSPHGEPRTFHSERAARMFFYQDARRDTPCAVHADCAYFAEGSWERDGSRVQCCGHSHGLLRADGWVKVATRLFDQ